MLVPFFYFRGMHKQAKEFCERIRDKFPDKFEGSALDVGSLDINGSNRYLFKGEYIGLDIGPGKNVDVVCPIHLYRSDPFDVVISTEMLEHDINWQRSLVNMQSLTAMGGILLFTCATTGRPEHGTKRTETKSSPYTTDYYRNLTENDCRSVMDLSGWDYGFEVNEEHNDLYFWGIKW